MARQGLTFISCALSRSRAFAAFASAFASAPHVMQGEKKVSDKRFQEALSEAMQRPVTKEEMTLINKAFDEHGDKSLTLDTYQRIVDYSATRAKIKKSHGKRGGQR